MDPFSSPGKVSNDNLMKRRSSSMMGPDPKRHKQYDGPQSMSMNMSMNMSMDMSMDMSMNSSLREKMNPITEASMRRAGGGYSDFAHRMMKKSGWTEGQGLGKDDTGRAEPIETMFKIGRQGLGFSDGTKYQTHTYASVDIVVKLKPEWCPKQSKPPKPTSADIDNWKANRLGLERRIKRVGDKRDFKSDFGNRELQQGLAYAKSFFDNKDSHAFMVARNKANPFESIKKEIFQNRAAMKMCEMDRVFNYLFTEPPCSCTYNKERDRVRTNPHPLFYHATNMDYDVVKFADICAGPGGFTEYFLHVHKWRARGFGFTLRGQDDFKVEKFNKCAPTWTFTPSYGEDNTGDITKTENMQHFRQFVHKRTINKEMGEQGVDVVMADGGFDVSSHYISQELFTQQLVLCQFTTALSILKKGGVFVCKVFDTFFPFTASLIYCLYLHFEDFCIFKPNQSRPANSEKYLIFKGLLEADPPVLNYLYRLNDIVGRLKDTDQMVQPIFSSTEMNNEFVEYLKSWNETLCSKQIDHLKRIKRYLEDPNLPSDNQDGLRAQCLKHWFTNTSGQPKIYSDMHYGKKFAWSSRYADTTSLLQLLNETVHGPKLLDLIKAELRSNQYTLVAPDDFRTGVFRKSKMSWWYSAAFKSKKRIERVILVSAFGKIFEAVWKEGFSAKVITNRELRFPNDSVIDCVKLEERGATVYKMLDAWVLGSKAIWKRPWRYRMEMCRLFHLQFFGRVFKFAGPIPVNNMLKKFGTTPTNVTLFLMRSRRVDQKGRVTHERPLKVKVWCDASIPFEDLKAEVGRLSKKSKR